MDSIDVELLITLVQGHPVIWDKTIEEYKDRTLTRNAWIEVFKQLNEKFEELEANEKNEYGKAVMKKWTNIRDCFQRSEKNFKATLKSGNARQPRKTYIFNDQLQFLKKSTVARPTYDSFSESVIDPRPRDPELSDDEGSVAEISPRNKEPENEEVQSFRKPSNVNKKKRKADPVELELILALKDNPIPNRHESFFKGIIPTLETFDDDEIVEFQLNVMQILSKMKRQKKQSSLTQSPKVNQPPSIQCNKKIQSPHKNKEKIVSVEGSTFHALQTSHSVNLASTATSAAQYYEDTGNSFPFDTDSIDSSSDNTTDSYNFFF